MKFKSLVLVGLMAGGTVGSAVPKAPYHFGCGAPPPSDSHRAVSKELAVQEAAFNSGLQINAASIVVDTYIHVVSIDQTATGGYLSRETIDKQMQVLNDNFAPSGIAFTLKDVDWTVNTNWARDRDSLNMKKKLRKGTYASLNLYYQTEVSGNLGVCYYPTTAQPGTTAFYQDGCTILFTSVPGGSATGYNEGKTTTHEVGHWFGLIHTFEGGCNAGDEVDDTPAQASATSGCPTGRDSCPNQAGLDPIHNYMDYSYDSCYEEFTTGQVNRMKSMWTRYRSGK
ncbi:metalloprotease 1 protein [Purpureocillium lilacinum]|uniref:Metalloprotease 1 protein n=1 Tax=Purpureocillium lilacinum TaxID=33203 RepID=A0A179HDJ4_PURLI|nr:metalloprotease 1 protein [Purpureocillium lilacinum]